MTLPEFLAKIEEAERAATPGPWLTEEPDDGEWAITYLGKVDFEEQSLPLGWIVDSEKGEDAKFIVLLRNHAPASLRAAHAEIAALKARLEAAEKVNAACEELLLYDHEHLRGCPLWAGVTGACTCGLGNAQAALDKALKAWRAITPPATAAKSETEAERP